MMAYRNPDVRFVQDLDAGQAASGVPVQKTIMMGPAFQIVADEPKGTLYDGGVTNYAYDEAGIVDDNEPRSDVLPIEQYPVRLFLSDIIVEFLANSAVGGGSHAPALATVVGSSFTLGANAYIDYLSSDDAVVASSIKVGDFVQLSLLPGHWFLIASIDTTSRRLNFQVEAGGAWGGAAFGSSSLSVTTPFIPSSTEPGGSAWTDTAVDYSALAAAAATDLLNVLLPGRLTERYEIGSLDTSDVTKLTVEESFTNSSRQAFGDATLALITTVDAISQDVSGLTAQALAEKLYAFFPGDGAFVQIASITDADTLELVTAWAGSTGTTKNLEVAYVGPETQAQYDIWRHRTGSAETGIVDLVTEIPRVDFDFLQVVVSAAAVQLPASLQNGGLNIVEAELHLRYRALDESFNAIVEYADTTELQAAFTAGAGALIPANPYGYGIQVGLSESGGRPISAIAPDATWLTDRATAMTEILSLLEEKDVYALVLLDDDPALAPLGNTHIASQSDSTVGYPRILLFNRRLITQSEVVAQASSGGTAPQGVAAGGLSMTDLAHAVSFVLAGVIAGNLLEILEATGPTVSDAGYSTAGTRNFVDENNNFPGVVIGDDLVIEEGSNAGTYSVVHVDASLNLIVVNQVLNGETQDVIAAAAVVPAGGALTPTALAPVPLEGDTLTLKGEVSLVNFETGVTGVAIPATIPITLPGPIKAGSTVLLDIDAAGPLAQQITISSSDTFTVSLGAMTINVAGCSINRTTGAIVLDILTVPAVITGDDWEATYTGVISATADEAGLLSIVGSGISAGAFDPTTGVWTGVVTVFDPAAGGTATHGTALVAAFSELVDYHIVHKGPTSYVVANQHTIGSVSADVLTFNASILGLGSNDIVGPLRPVTYEVVKDLTLSEEASTMAGVASGFGTRRASMTWPDIFKASVQNVVQDVPGWVGAAIVGGFCALEPPHQGFTKKTAATVTGRTNGKDRFRTTARLNTIAGGGILMFEQDSPGAAIYVRHQLTTDVSAILFQELSVTRNLDSIQAQLKSVVASFLGTWNIQDGLFVALTNKINGRIQRLINRRTPKIGGQLRGGSRMTQLIVDPTAADTILSTVKAKVPVPLNNVDVTIEASAS